MKTGFVVSFVVCFLCYAIRTAFNILKYKRHKLVEKKGTMVIIYIVMFVLWFSWAQMCFFDPFEITMSGSVRYIGLILFLIGIFILIISHTSLKGFEDKGQLVTKGIYSKIRNPMYLGFILWIIGFPLFLQSPVALASGIIWIAHIMYWKMLEEKELEKKYEAYREYKQKTWF